MDPTLGEQCLQMAQERPNILCSEVPLEVLEACALEAEEPTHFLQDLFRSGHTQWLSHNHGQNVRISKDRMNNAIMVLWLRACHLYASHILGRPDPAWERPFFSDEGLY